MGTSEIDNSIMKLFIPAYLFAVTLAACPSVQPSSCNMCDYLSKKCKKELGVKKKCRLLCVDLSDCPKFKPRQCSDKAHFPRKCLRGNKPLKQYLNKMCRKEKKNEN